MPNSSATEDRTSTGGSTAGERRFPIMDEHCKSLPWDMLEPHEAQAIRNHGQTLKELAERGGLDIVEAHCILHDKPFPWGDIFPGMIEAARNGMALMVIERYRGRARLEIRSPASPSPAQGPVSNADEIKE